jgi:predicted ester cyclase
MSDASQAAIAARNKANYLAAKAAFNAQDMTGCMAFYALDHRIMSRDFGPGRVHIEQFLTAMHATWGDLHIVVDHAIAEGDWVTGRCTSTAKHVRLVMGVAPTGHQITASFWDMHKFDGDGRIIETWNMMDSLSIMQQLGLLRAAA